MARSRVPCRGWHGQHDAHGHASRSRPRGGGGSAVSSCSIDDLGDARAGQVEQLVELAAGERHALGRALHLDEAARAGSSPRSCRLRRGVLDVRQVEHGHAVDDADRDRRARSRNGCGLGPPGLHQAAERVVQRDVAAADRRGTRTAVGLQHVAVDDDRALAEHRQVAHRPQRPADEPLDLLRAPAAAPAPRGRRARASSRAASSTRPSPSRCPCPSSSVARRRRPTQCTAPGCARTRRAPSRGSSR